MTTLLTKYTNLIQNLVGEVSSGVSSLNAYEDLITVLGTQPPDDKEISPELNQVVSSLQSASEEITALNKKFEHSVNGNLSIPPK